MKEVKNKKNLGFVLLFVLLLVINPWFVVLTREPESLSKINLSITSSFTESLSRYFDSFSGKFLFFSGDWLSLGKAMDSQGVLYLADGLLLVIGMAFLFRTKRDFLDNFALCLFFLTPLPSAIFTQNALFITSSLMIFPLVFLITSGIMAIYKKSKLWLVSMTLFYLVSLARFYDLYFLH
ncbi:MAG: hypothetical protein ACOX50_02880 [Patescibacteria group bacterium]|jgi:hypothetical protein